MTTSATGGGSSPASFTNKNRVTGLASGSAGFNTQQIVEGLMALERQPYDKLDIKRQTEQLRLQAYQAVNTYLLNFRNSVSTLASRKLWNSKTTVSSNEKSLTATANEYAVKGSYSFKVAQLATATQYMSKGFADSKAAISPPKKVPGEDGKLVDAPPEKLGTLNVASSKTRVDNSAKLEMLNGGRGVFRGSVRITDGNNGTANIDLSAADSLDDVVRTINEASGVRINASIRDGRLHIADESGGTGTLKIQNVGAGTTATDLGIAGSSNPGDGFFQGRNVFTLGPDMSLNMLNDGLGVEEGTIGLRVYGKNDANEDVFVEVAVNLDGAKTVGDVMTRVNDAIEERRKTDETDPAGGGKYADVLKNLRFGVNGDGTGFGLTGVKEGNTYQFIDVVNPDAKGQMRPADQLGLTDDVHSVGAGEREVAFGRVLGDANSPMLKNLGGAADGGVGSYPPESRIPVTFDRNTKISSLNGGEGLDLSTGFNFMLLEGGKSADGVEISTDANIISNAVNMIDFRQWVKDNPDATLEDLVNKLNLDIGDFAGKAENNAAGLNGIHFSIDEYNQRLIIDGVQAGYSLQIAGGLAQSLGLDRFRAGTAIGSAIEIDPEDDSKDALRDAIDKFYGMDDHNKPIHDEDILLEADGDDEATTMGDLSDLLEGGKTLNDLFGSGKGVTIKVGNALDTKGTPDDPTDDEIVHDYAEPPAGMGPAMEITVDWDSLTDKDGNALGPITSDMDVGVVVDAMNRAIEKAFKETVQANGTSTYKGSVPQLRVNALANGLQWSNMDFTNYWQMSDSGGGTALEAMNLERDITRDITAATHGPTSKAYNYNPAEIAYLEKVELNGTTADTITIGELNYGVGITLAGEDGDTVDIEFKPSTAAEDEAYNGKKVSFTMRELRDAVADKVADLGLTDKSELTVNEYLGVLNGLVDSKIDEYYTATEPGVDADDRFSLDFKVADDGTFIVDGLENSDGLTIAGNGTDFPYGTRSGLATTVLTKDQIAELDKAGKNIVVNLAGDNVGGIVRQDIDGLGEIYFTLDGNDDYDSIFRLNTTGLDQNSTLNDLMNHLNDQLAKMGSDPADPQYNALLKDVKFVLNDSGTGIAVDNGSNARVTFIDAFQLKTGVDATDPAEANDPANRISDAQRLAQDLGLVGADGSSRTVESYSFLNAKSIGRNYISRATSLEGFIGKDVMESGLRLTNAGGYSANIDVSAAKTIGDIIDAINSADFGLAAQINAAGDGLDIFEYYSPGKEPPASQRQGEIGIADVEGGVNVAKKLGIAGAGKRSAESGNRSAIRGSLTPSIEVMSTDSLEDLMYRLSEAGYKTSIINDGSAFRLSVSAAGTGEKNDFVIETDVAQLGFTQTSRGRDSKVLYGDPNSSSSPVMLSSETNSNSTAINGVTLDLKEASSSWTTITIDDDKEQVTEAVKTMVTSYNELSEIIKMLDAYDTETGEEGILFGDTSVRSLMDDINEYFYNIYNPDNQVVGSVDDDGKQQTWTWMDLGITLNATPSNADGTGGWYNTIELDEDALTNMVASNWDVMSKMLSNERNVSTVNAADNVKPTGSFNGELDEGFGEDGAINGDINKSSFGTSNGIQGKGTMAEGDNAYTIWFQKTTRLNRMTISFPSKETALKDYEIEYLDAASGQWKPLRKTEGNTLDSVGYGFMTENVNASAVRITGKTSNAEDDKFRLLDVQIFEETGLAGKMNQHTTELGDVQFGFLAEMNDEIQSNLTDIEDQMLRLQEKLTLKEESMWRRFSAMESAMAKLQSQGDYFTNMMNSLGGGQ